jgi:hypothetical protein
MKKNLFLFFYLGACVCLGQRAEGILYLEMNTFQLEELPDSVTCRSYASLESRVKTFNRKQLKHAYTLADSLSKEEFPCFEFVVITNCNIQLEDLISAPEDCILIMGPSYHTWINGTFQLYKRRRLDALTIPTSTTYCPEELRRD